MRSEALQVGELARRTGLTVRTLHHYDEIGLLKPSLRTGSGRRLYTGQDVARLQQVLSLRQLGFSLEEIRACLHRPGFSPLEVIRLHIARLREQIEMQKGLCERLEKLAWYMGTAEEVSVEQLLDTLEAMNMWEKYFSEEQIQKMQELGAASYSEEALKKLQQRGLAQPWTEEDQRRASGQWEHVAAEARRLAAAGADPGGEEGQAVARLKCELLAVFTQGDPEITEGLGRFWKNFNALPAHERPFDASPFDPGEAGREFLEKAMAIYRPGFEPRTGPGTTG
jgi:DNA-binding transcriptional MerR regulator